MKSPGLLARHYSPRAPLTLYEGNASRVIARMAADARAATARGQRVGIVAADEDELSGASHEGLHVIRLGPEHDGATLAANLYNALRTLDAAGVDLILARTFAGQSGLTVAIHDRLHRAAAGRTVRVDA